jgi:polyisoprenoid-binding protein YceI
MLKGKLWSWILPIFTAFAIVLIGARTYTYNEYDFSFQQISIFLLPVFGAMVLPIVKMKTALIRKLFGMNDVDGIENALILLLIGIAAFIGMFFASGFGLFLIALGFASHYFYQNEKYGTPVIVLLSLSLIHYFKQYVPTDSVDLAFGKTLEGLFIGAFSVYFIHEIHKKSQNILLQLLSFGLAILLTIGVLLLATQKEDFGGMDAFIGVLIGAGIVRLFVGEFLASNALFALTVGVGLIFGPFTINEEEQQAGQIIVNTVNSQSGETEMPVESPFDMDGLNISNIQGTYKINTSSVQLNFQLGPKGGITKGSFKSFSGNIKIDSNIESSTFSVSLPVSELTTFNSYRDESLMEKEYFNVKEFSEMKFDSKKMKSIGDGYELQGDFTMLGITKALKVQVKYVGNNEKTGEPILVGKSIIDRTLFGMTPDSKEGNEVEFIFKIELTKI